MPREIITLQFGQCGNQSKLANDFFHFRYYVRKYFTVRAIFKLAWSFGNACAWNMALAKVSMNLRHQIVTTCTVSMF
jgi:hypothetical protein